MDFKKLLGLKNNKGIGAFIFYSALINKGKVGGGCLRRASKCNKDLGEDLASLVWRVDL